MLQALKAFTSTRHAALARRLPLLDANLPQATYRHYVQRLFGYYEPLETQLLALPWWGGVGVDYPQRAKTPRLRQDLVVLGDTASGIATLPRCACLPPLNNVAQLWARLYVIKGATLGGQIIIKHLNAHLGLAALSDASLFGGYGRHTGAHWKDFCAAVPAQGGVTPNACEAMLTNANQTFDTRSEWLFPGAPVSAGDRSV